MMSIKAACWTCTFAVALFLCEAQAELIGHWTLDETSGTVAADASGRSHHGTYVNSPDLTVAGVFGTGMDSTGGYMEVDLGPDLPLGAEERTITLWLRTAIVPGDRKFCSYGAETNGQGFTFCIENVDGKDGVRLRHWGGNMFYPGFTVGQWNHLALRVPAGATLTTQTEVLINGVQSAGYRSSGSDLALATVASPFRVGTSIGAQTGQVFEGTFDDVYFFDHALTDQEVRKVMAGAPKELAVTPVPDDATADVSYDTDLSWTAGALAQAHDVYLGTTFEDVNTASRTDAKGVLVSQGQAATVFRPDSLVFGRTYFWRIDEVNGPPGNTIFKGSVWSFMVEPYGYPITPVAATASSAQPGMGPENTINGSGLEAGGLHGTEPKTMWMSAGVLPNWIQYEFDKVYKLHDLQIWNSNQLVEAFLGFGARKVTIEVSPDGTTWTPVADVPEFAKAPGAPDYAANTTVSLGGVEAKVVKLTIDSNWGGVAPQIGLAEVRFSYVPMQARQPMPADGAAEVSLDAELTWRPGRAAASHQVYFGTDANAVANGMVSAQTVTDHGYTPDALDLGTTYYWRVDEVNAVTYPGALWSFTTREYQVVDDFESYTDQAGEEIFSTWIDGYADQSSGSTVGLLTAVNGTFGETTIVHGDKQSMPLAYDNTAAPQYSEAVRTFDTPQDWTAHGIKSLSLWFQGGAGNGGKLYMKINNTKVAYDGDATDLARAGWQVWNIDLSKAGKVNSVRSLTIGVEGAGAKGTLYLDDIRLYPKAPEYRTPVEPTQGLAAYYPLDGDYGDRSGNGRNGTAVGAPTFAAGRTGQAVSLDGAGDYISIDNWQGILGGSPFTISLWVNSAALDDRTMVCWGGATNGTRVDFRLYEGRLRVEHGNGNLQGNTVLADGQWHHAALVVTPDAWLQYPQVALYLDGLNDTQSTADPDVFGTVADVPVTIGQRRTNNDRDFQGMLDEVRIFDRPLSPEEVAWLAGRRMPVHQPF